MKRWIGKGMVIAAALLWAAHADAQGYSFCWPAAGASTYTGTCTATGSFVGHTVPRCATGTDGGFTIWTPALLSGAAASITLSNLNFLNNSTVATGNKCFRASFASVTNDADVSTITYSAPTTLVTKDLSTCTTGTTPLCATGAFPANNSKDLATGIACTGSACVNRPLLAKIEVMATGCTGEGVTAVDVVGVCGSVAP